MRTLWLVVLAGCWSSSSKPATAPSPAPAPAAESSASAAGGSEYGGSDYALMSGRAVATLDSSLGASSGLGASGGTGGSAGSGIGGIGSGGIATGTGTGTTSGYGIGSIGSAGNGAAVPLVAIGTPSSQGDLDKAIIRRYVKRNQQKIQYCYEKELLARSGIRGKVVVDFEISVDGTVVQATGTADRAAGTGLKNVADCVTAVIGAIEFPKPKGGTSVQVSYPFVFEPS